MSEATLSAQKARAELYRIVRKDTSLQEKIRAALELGRQYLDTDSGHLTRIDQETDHWTVRVSTDTPDGQFHTGLEADLETTYCRRTIESDSQVVLRDAPNQGWSDDPAFEAHGLHCYHGTTLVVDDDPYGTVVFVAKEPRSGAFTDGETMFAGLIAQLLERELERRREKAELTRQANLATVLNRVLRHNIRNDMSVIRGFTQLMAEQLDDTGYSEVALDTIDDLIELSQKARQLDRIVAADFERESTDLVALVQDVAGTVAAAYPRATVSVESDDDISAAVLPTFERAVEELLENAVKHSGDRPTVAVIVEPVPNAVEIRIVDDGPGLADHEADVLKTGAETPLTHGSGLGLWLAHWIVASHDGSITPTVSPSGTTMTISVPRTTAANVQQQLSKLTRARDQYQAAFEGASDGMVIVNEDARIVDANPEAATIYGLEREPLLGRSLTEFLPDEFDFETSWQKFRNGTTERETTTIVGADGIEREVEYAATADIVPGQHLIVGRDITEQVRQEAELRYKTRAMDEAPVGITLSDPDRDDNPMVYTNDRFLELTGYDEDEVLGRNCRFVQGERTDPESAQKFREAIDNQEPASVVLRNYRKDGSTFWNRASIAPVRDGDGEVIRWVGFQEDVTELIERERTLEETSQRLEAIVATCPHPVFALDADGTVQLWNEAAEDVFGYAADAIRGTPIESLQLHTAKQRSEVSRILRRALDGEAFTDLWIQRQTADGDRLQLSLSTRPIRDDADRVTGVVAVAKDMTSYIGSKRPN